MLDNIINLTENDFDEYVATHDGIIITHKTLCPHCKIMGKTLLKVCEKNPEINIASVDSEADPALLKKLGVERVPSLIVFKSGIQKAAKTGIMNPKETLTFYKQA